MIHDTLQAGASVKSLMDWRIAWRNTLRTRFLKLVLPFMSYCIFNNSLGQTHWGFCYPNEYLHNLNAEVNRKLPRDTGVIQIAPTPHLEEKLPTAIKLPTPEMLLAFWSLEKILQLEVTDICKTPDTPGNDHNHLTMFKNILSPRWTK